MRTTIVRHKLEMAGLFVEPGQLLNEISVHDISTTETVQLYKDLTT